jgi:hypothetical protein
MKGDKILDLVNLSYDVECFIKGKIFGYCTAKGCKDKYDYKVEIGVKTIRYLCKDHYQEVNDIVKII